MSFSVEQLKKSRNNVETVLGFHTNWKNENLWSNESTDKHSIQTNPKAMAGMLENDGEGVR